MNWAIGIAAWIILSVPAGLVIGRYLRARPPERRP